ncbi:MAG TPA: Lrp/AsnC family transcriptional regulator [Ignavibacteria bacterium]|nr:Lrp/AsnC family transcriptional regulator [Ignavibacteria bacterium]HAX49614.1 AsnC family transcriptional regulator [Bacteroidota bacterium]HRE12259.1 Lrp/AsnC family transcriptional regulator [Ignavibacteria bacterium]HRF67566.1 Lrp/AsnC family transcriptional regulator [Ignavibacteria bacterium]HRJ05370.1 Lrp/AsnC family transcriptional regulator [Ignavibacteria bacterium]
MHTIDETDLKILEYLQDNARMKRNELAEKVGLSLPSVTDRMNKLEELGVTERFITKLNHKLLGKDITAFIFVTSDSSTHYRDFINHAISAAEVLECHSITGDGSHILKIRTENTSSLEKLLAKIQSWKGVRSTRTSIVLSSHKETFAVDLKHYKK